MNWAPPQYIKDAAKNALEETASNHYIIPRGLLRLRQALSKHFSPSFNLPEGRALDVDSEVRFL